MPNEFRIVDNSDLVGEELKKACLKALTECGLVAEKYAKQLVPVNTGNLRNSVTHIVKDKEAYIGTDVDYGVYVEMGTGKFIPGGSAPWVYRDDQGNFHRTSGQPPKPFIKPSVADHLQEYMEIIQENLKGR